MNVWMIWLKAERHIWLEATWGGRTNSMAWRDMVERARKRAHKHGYEIRIQLVDVPGVQELFETPRATARARPMDWKMWGSDEVTYPLPVEAKDKP